MVRREERLVVIPADWRAAVCRVLDTHDPDLIQATTQADRDWHSSYPTAWDFERDDAMAASLRMDDVKGLHIMDMIPPCDAYAFWFSYGRDLMYGKIGLLPCGKIIVVFSSHKPRKGEASL